jgi:uncharacterized membrane protein
MSSKHHATQSQGRQQKKAEFQNTPNEPANKRKFFVLVGIVVVLSAVAGYLILGGGSSEGVPKTSARTISAPGQDVQIPLSEVSDGKAKFYNYTLADNQKVGFFVVKSSDGVVRAAFNACDVCYEHRRGYRQEGDDMVCNNCGQHFPSNRVNDVKGGCNPAPLERAVEGDHLVIKASDLRQGAFYF